MQIRHHWISCILVFIVSSGQLACTKQANLTAGIRSFQHQDYRHAFNRLHKEAKQGRVEAEYAVGYMYYYGQGVIENRHKALYWIQKAAQAGYPEARQALTMLQQ